MKVKKRPNEQTQTKKAAEVEAHVKRKYSVLSEVIFPKNTPAEIIQKQAKGFLVLAPIKLDDPAKLEAVHLWLNQNLKSVSVVVEDSLLRLRLQRQEGLTEKEAWARALMTGRDFSTKYSHLFSSNPHCSYQLRYGSELRRTPDYRLMYNSLFNAFRNNKEFNLLVRERANEDISSSEMESQEHVPGSKNNPISLSIQSILEKLALFSCLKKEGWPLLLSPQELPVLRGLNQENSGQLPKSLSELIGVELRLADQGKGRRWISRRSLWNTPPKNNS